jgi:acyl-CoA thioesterase FadM
LPSIAKVDRLAEAVRVLEVSGVDVSRLTLFFVGRMWNFSRRLYQQAAVDYPMSVRCVISRVGGSSYDTQLKYFEGDGADADAGNGPVPDPLATVVYRVVNVDPEAFKPMPLPKYFVDALTANFAPGGLQFPMLSPPAVAEESKTFRCRIQVRYDDMDMLFHTNHAAYLSFALECATQAAKAGFYSKIRQDLAFYEARGTTSVHLGQSRAGDELEVASWEDQDNPLLLHFLISKDDQVIYYTKVEYYNEAPPLQSQL